MSSRITQTPEEPRVIGRGMIDPKINVTIFRFQNIDPENIVVIQISENMFCHKRVSSYWKISDTKSTLRLTCSDYIPAYVMDALSIVASTPKEISHNLRNLRQNGLRDRINWKSINRNGEDTWIYQSFFSSIRKMKTFPSVASITNFVNHMLEDLISNTLGRDKDAEVFKRKRS